MDEQVVSTAEEEQKTTQVEEVDKNPQPQNKKTKFWTLTKKLSKRWFIDAFTGMAQGLFVTLIAGTIFTTLGQYIFTDKNAIGRLLLVAGRFASLLMGAGIGAGIAHRLKMPPLVVFSAIVAGFIGAHADFFTSVAVNPKAVTTLVITEFFKPNGATMPGNPIGAYITALLACEISNLVAGKTKLDIIIIPIVSITLSILGAYVSYPFIWLINMLGKGFLYGYFYRCNHGRTFDNAHVERGNMGGDSLAYDWNGGGNGNAHRRRSGDCRLR